VQTFSIAISSDDKRIWKSGYGADGDILKFSVRHGQMIKDYGAIFVKDLLRTIIMTPDNKWLFAASYEVHLKQISLESQQVVHDYGKIHYDPIRYLETTRDSKWLITGGWDGHFNRISVENRGVDKDFGQV
jgi:WD40 repeat protein